MVFTRKYITETGRITRPSKKVGIQIPRSPCFFAHAIGLKFITFYLVGPAPIFVGEPEIESGLYPPGHFHARQSRLAKMPARVKQFTRAPSGTYFGRGSGSWTHHHTHPKGACCRYTMPRFALRSFSAGGVTSLSRRLSCISCKPLLGRPQLKASIGDLVFDRALPWGYTCREVSRAAMPYSLFFRISRIVEPYKNTIAGFGNSFKVWYS